MSVDRPIGEKDSGEEHETGPIHVKDEDHDQIRVRSQLRPLLDDKDGTVVLGRSESSHRKWRRKATMDIGMVAEHQDSGEDLYSRRVLIDAAFPHIIFICGKRGSGKSYTLGLFAEEIARTSIGLGAVLIDPIGIFWSLKKENGSHREKEELARWGLSAHSFPEVRVLVPGRPESLALGAADGPFTIGVGEMTAEDWCQVFDMDRFKTQGLLVGAALEQVKKGYIALGDGTTVKVPGKGHRFSIGDLINCIRSSSVLTSKEGGFTPQTRRSLIARFNAAGGWGIFSIDGTPLKDISSPNRITVIDVSDPMLGDDKRSLVTGILARKVLSARIYSARLEEQGRYDTTDPSHIPVTWLMIDEAHVILPHGKQTPATDALVEYAKQGRRPGCGLILATQRPASTSDEILSQVDLVIGHNLALEDDMSAFRRRVPAKLPPEFANSDFIRAIQVGTAIVADQRTQQRSFLMRLRPRMSHHAGSSAMPSALAERKEREQVPMSATSSVFADPSEVLAPTDDLVPEVDEGIPPATEADWIGTTDHQEGSLIEDHGNMGHETVRTPTQDPLGIIQDGNSILMVTQDTEAMAIGARKMWRNRGFILLARTHPSRYPGIDALFPERTFWLSSTPSDISAPPNAIQDLLMDIGRTLDMGGRKVLVFDGVETLFNENDHRSVIRFFQVLREKVFLGGHILIVRVDPSTPEEMIENLSREMDSVLKTPREEEDHPARPSPGIETVEDPQDAGRKPPEDRTLVDTARIEKVDGGKIAPSIGPHPSTGSLSLKDLREMCRILDLPEEGDKGALLERILSSGKVNAMAVDAGLKGEALEALSEITRLGKESSELNERIARLEDDLVPGKGAKGRGSTGQRSKGKRTKRWQVVWEDEGTANLPEGDNGRSGREVPITPESLETVRSEIATLRERIERLQKETMENLRSLRPESLAPLLERMDAQSSEALSRIKGLEESVRENPKVRTGPEPGEVTEKDLPSKVPAEPPEKGPRTLPRLKVPKKGPSMVMVRAKVSSEQASNTVRKTLKRTLLRGPLERIVEVQPAFLPLYRVLVNYRSGLLKKVRTGDVYVDAVAQEIVLSLGGGIVRTSGIGKLLALTPMESKGFSAMGKGYNDESEIMARSGLNRTQVRRVMGSLERKGLVDHREMEGKIRHYSVPSRIGMGEEPWKRSPDLDIRTLEASGEKVIEAGIDPDKARSIVGTFGPGLTVQEVDLVHYPIYVVTVEGEGRVRHCIVDGLSARSDDVLTSMSKTVVARMRPM